MPTIPTADAIEKASDSSTVDPHLAGNKDGDEADGEKPKEKVKHVKVLVTGYGVRGLSRTVLIS